MAETSLMVVAHRSGESIDVYAALLDGRVTKLPRGTVWSSWRAAIPEGLSTWGFEGFGGPGRGEVELVERSAPVHVVEFLGLDAPRAADPTPEPDANLSCHSCHSPIGGEETHYVLRATVTSRVGTEDGGSRAVVDDRLSCSDCARSWMRSVRGA